MGTLWPILGILLVCAGLARADDVRADDVAALRERLRGGVESSAVASANERDAGALIVIFEDGAEERHVRLRALSWLAQLHDARTQAFFARLLGRASEAQAPTDALDPRRSSLVLRRAVDGLLAVAPNDRSVELVAPFLAHRDARIREAVARGLVRVGSEKARQLARARLNQEVSKAVRAQLSLLLTPAGATTDRPARPPALPTNGPESAPRPR